MSLRDKADEIVNNCSLTSAGYAFATSPIPGTTAGVVAAEAWMVCEIAKVYGFSLSPSEATRLITSLLAAGTAVKITLNEFLTFLPGIGYVAKAAIAGYSTKALGELAIQHFEERYKTEKA